MSGHAVAAAAVALASVATGTTQAADELAERWEEALEQINAEHARKPGQAREDDLAARLPARARKEFERLLGLGPKDEPGPALARAAEAALELALVDDFERARARLAELDSAAASALGTALSRPRFLLRGIGGLDQAYLEHFAQVLDGVLDAYDELFGFDEPSKVPGKKLRVRLHLEREITRPPHFAPQFPWHSEIDFPVVDAERLRSPTADGKFLFYGLCHELGHVVAMWGDRSREADHHTWAHYTGVAVVEHLTARAERPPWMAELRDARWRSLEREREQARGVEPATDSSAGCMALWIALHDGVGPRAIGDAIDRLDREDRRLRVNRVRYYRFEELRESLLEVVEKAEAERLVRGLLSR